MDYKTHARSFVIYGIIILISCFLFVEFMYLITGSVNFIAMIFVCGFIVCGIVITAIGINQLIIIRDSAEIKEQKK